ncbi:MAG TPA: adenosylcobinamide-GDP ribazoletransferase, partial [Candidatus Binataceae bacterium]|nr:adenosylcobinamide-GDP ribazoletransferase [Candidatus Binataceae bacterium]
IVAIATLSRWSLLARGDFGDAEARARSLAFLPIVGLVAGIGFAFVDRSIGSSFVVISMMEIATGAMDLVGVADLIDAIRIGARPASTGIARIGPIGALAAVAWLIATTSLLARIHEPADRSATLVMAVMLSRWALVPIAYGLRPLERWGLGVPFEGPIRFREFSLSSAVAIFLTLMLYENVGLAIIVALALTILAMRLVLSRRLGGAAGYALAGGMALCELVVIATMAALAR